MAELGQMSYFSKQEEKKGNLAISGNGKHIGHSPLGTATLSERLSG